MKKTADKLAKGICLVAMVSVLGACGQKEASAPGTEAQVTEAETWEKAGEKEGESAEQASTAEETESETMEEDSSEAESSGETETESQAETEPASETESQAETEKAGGAETEAASEPAGESEAPAAKAVSDIYSQIIQSVSLESPMTVSDDFISSYYGIDVSTLDEYVFSMSEAATSAETVVILKAKDENATGALSAALQVVIDEKRAEMENYLPEQFQIVDRSSVQKKGRYVYLVISQQADAIKQIIEAGIQ